VWALILVACTLVLVLVVLPQRFVLSSGFRESGVSFPVTETPVPPLAVVQRTAPPGPAPRPSSAETVVYRGPAEILWDRAGPLMEAGRYDEAAALFQAYLQDNPGDQGVRMEMINALLRAGRRGEAADALREYLARDDDSEARLLLARTLRDMGRTDEASAQYARLEEEGAGGSDLALEWAQALSWAERFPEAEDVLVSALESDPDNAALQVELARLYYATDRLPESDAILAGMDEEALGEYDALDLRDDVAAALEVPEEEPAPPPSLMEQAAAAREAGDFTAAAALLQEALADTPDDVEAWRAYADLLQYEMSDFPGALEALREIESRTPRDTALQYRMAQLELWTGENEAASLRLDGVLASLGDSGPVPLSEDPEPVLLTAPDVLALQGDILRWKGDRVAAGREYDAALAEDPEHEPAQAGLASLRSEADDAIEEAEGPRIGAFAYWLDDNDDFRRLDLGGEWIGVRGDWAWGIQAGNRWLEGLTLAGTGGDASGLFVDVEGARWWRWGTVRTALHVGAETVRDGATDVSFGASVRALGMGPFSSVEARYHHGLAYPITTTLQSVFAQVVQDNLRITLNADITPVWTLWAQASGTRLATQDFVGDPDPSLRLQGAVALGRRLSGGFTVGLGTEILGFTEPAPSTSAVSLFWDPKLSASLGPFAQFQRELQGGWDVYARVSPSMAWIEEREVPEGEWVPHASAEGRIRYRGERLWTSLDVFFGQGRFDGYRNWGGRLTFSVRNLPWLGGGS
jgi:tetratricopeptide (TPR) repeat protein